MDVKPGYKQTEVGVIPGDWQVRRLGDLFTIKGGVAFSSAHFSDKGPILLTPGNFSLNGRLYFNARNTKYYSGPYDSSMVFNYGDLILVMTDLTHDCNLLGKPAFVQVRDKILHNQRIGKISPSNHRISLPFLYWHLLSDVHAKRMRDTATGSTVRHTSNSSIYSGLIALPPTRAEQGVIAEALSDADALIESLEQLIAKKRAIKIGAMQQLLTGRRRLPGFESTSAHTITEGELLPDDWSVTTLEQVTDCLDKLRIPLNESQRASRQGNIPYCGANGILDYIDDFVLDDNVILMAEDGGYFDEYTTRPIAYRMTGKSWVNNHAHILKAKSRVDQDFIFYSLVHKNILRFLASGTRAKLNRSELNKIEVSLPHMKSEQEAIAAVLSDMDDEIAALEQTAAKARLVKQGMMQELLTGRTRLI
jgi:type I restriction enzyme, S subunit